MQTQRVILTPKTVLCFSVCVDKNRGYDFSGHLYDGLSARVRLFRNVEELLRIMSMYDSRVYPQMLCELRDFNVSPRRYEHRGRVGRMEKQPKTQPEIVPGQKATFVVHVQYRQNATWQGSVDWLENKRSQKFRSSLELIKLMDSALNADGADTPKWE